MWAIIIVYLIVHGALVGFGIGTGLFLRWLFPEMEVGMALLIGVLSTVGAWHFFARFIKATGEEVISDEALPRFQILEPISSRRKKSKR